MSPIKIHGIIEHNIFSALTAILEPQRPLVVSSHIKLLVSDISAKNLSGNWNCEGGGDSAGRY